MTIQQIAKPQYTRPQNSKLINVLHIEDSDGDAFLFSSILQKSTFGSISINRSSFLEEAVKSLKNNTAYDIIFTDLGLPDAYGIEIISEIKALGVNVPIIALSGSVDPQIERDVKGVGATCYLSKDAVNPTQLEKILTQFL